MLLSSTMDPAAGCFSCPFYTSAKGISRLANSLATFLSVNEELLHGATHGYSRAPFPRRAKFCICGLG